MKYQSVTGLTAMACVLLCGCSAHSPLIVKNTTDTSLVSQTKYAAYDGKVFVTEQALPANLKYDVIGTIEVGKVWYGSSSNALTAMVERARELGANAVIDAKTWHQPSGFSWAAPHGSGTAVRIADMNAFRSLGVNGDWY